MRRAREYIYVEGVPLSAVDLPDVPELAFAVVGVDFVSAPEPDFAPASVFAAGSTAFSGGGESESVALVVAVLRLSVT